MKNREVRKIRIIRENMKIKRNPRIKDNGDIRETKKRRRMKSTVETIDNLKLGVKRVRKELKD